jgi:nitrogen fixation/metabolism regulation signal transduction histidine kinase
MLDSLYQERLRVGEQRGFLDQLLEATPGAVVVFDFDGRVSLCNAFATQLLGDDIQIGQVLGHTNSSLTSRFVGELTTIQVGDSQMLSNEEGRRFRCQRSQFVDRGFRREFLLIDEITEELASSEKATYEKLVRVLAHEVNNTVAATGSVLESLLFYRQQLTEEDATDFSTAVVAVQRRNQTLAQFIARFTEVVKMPDVQLHLCDVVEMIDAAMVLYRQRCVERGIRLAWGVKQEIPAQKLDYHLFEQAILNIVKNAIEAVESAQRQQPEHQGFVQIDLSWEAELEAVKLSVIVSGRG